ncbi:hypothetical protein GLOIN_2v1772262 [Rhizophagus irregularis DAOM 181602=DAOM 197198]|uniref:Uncharacterized protein n=1 Tax=Rhizophagus irregularis (strain DAOM 181602 / DAOM 197198 / MUCL 43194) TaxID=747089 RepID=A0A2P4Q7J1_RHIID|nr:hypothetical protein GLOIN_2v1772262 [Rhizophagus irregularis DAOM 181602=DAOM 197198]POG73605.1 hypothetical protein GLOIN_2v1772262 [Rhizophagus irregularis DAOM 181602=DAOM 197198]|eukprot:XP_025180471.1 hypothetical protein GLOIN_2v1772262 [Rhizophagus irregularis DAOM 181602=DAOM 197198]
MEQSHKSDRSEAVPDHILKVVEPAEAEPDHIIELAEAVPDQIPKVAPKVIPMKGRMVHSIWFYPELEHAYEIECLRKYDEDNQTKMSESNAKLQDTSSSSIKASNIPTEIVSSDSNESGKEQTSKISESSAKLQDTSSSLFIKDFRNKPTRFDHQPSKKKSKMPEKSKKSSSIKAFNKSTEVVSSDDESHQPKKNSKNSKKKSKSKKSKNSERTSGLETDSSPAAPRKVTYHSLTELPKDTKDNLRREVKWNIKRMPTGSQLDINKTFESQKDLVTKIIIPALFKVLDTNTYPVSEGVLYEMIHQRHRHQREDLLKKEKSEFERTEETKRKHGNSRRSEKRIRRTNMVRHLQLLDDPIVSKLKKSELNPIMLENAYHSPEESEVNSD